MRRYPYGYAAQEACRPHASIWERAYAFGIRRFFYIAPLSLRIRGANGVQAARLYLGRAYAYGIRRARGAIALGDTRRAKNVMMKMPCMPEKRA